MAASIELRVNGKKYTVQANPDTPLLYILRNQLGLNGPKFGCGLQQCGACMVLLDGKARPSCRLPLQDAAKNAITTLEGLVSADGKLHPIQEAIVQEQATQCGYCLNAMVMSAVSLLKQNPHPDHDAICGGMQTALCRCGSQARIIRAIERVAAANH
jgi:nicotinate dehydrogenase subunit A